MKAVVTGAAGHVGANLVRALLAEGRQVRALVYRDRRALEGLDVELVEGDVLDRASLDRAFDGVEVVFHLAAHVSISAGEHDLVEAINVLGTGNVVDACLASPSVRRLVHASSIHAMSQQPLDEVIDETRPLADTGPSADYDRSKARGERQVLAGVERGLDAVIAVPGAVIGPYDFKPSHMGQVLLSIARGHMPAMTPGGYNWVDARDVAAGILAVEAKGRTGEKYLLTGHWASMVELGRLASQAVGRRPPSLVVPMWLAALSGPFAEAYGKLSGARPLFTSEAIRVLRGNTRFSHEKAARELGYGPRPTEEMVRDTIEWFASAGMLRAGRPAGGQSDATTSGLQRAKPEVR